MQSRGVQRPSQGGRKMKTMAKREVVVKQRRKPTLTVTLSPSSISYIESQAKADSRSMSSWLDVLIERHRIASIAEPQR